MKNNIFLFDLDGLLIDSEKVYKKAWKHAFEKLGTPMPDEILNRWAGKNTHYMAADVVKIYHEIQIYHNAYAVREEFICESLKNGDILQKKFATEALTTLKECGYITGLVTSSPRNRVMNILEYFDWKNKMDYIITASDVTETKPSPVPYINILKQADLKPKQAVAFEDSLTGYTAAQKAGVNVFLIPDVSFPIEEEKIANCQRACDLSKVLELIFEEI